VTRSSCSRGGWRGSSGRTRERRRLESQTGETVGADFRRVGGSTSAQSGRGRKRAVEGRMPAAAQGQLGSVRGINSISDGLIERLSLTRYYNGAWEKPILR
jgi:hypothetical protein